MGNRIEMNQITVVHQKEITGKTNVTFVSSDYPFDVVEDSRNILLDLLDEYQEQSALLYPIIHFKQEGVQFAFVAKHNDLCFGTDSYPERVSPLMVELKAERDLDQFITYVTTGEELLSVPTQYGEQGPFVYLGCIHPLVALEKANDYLGTEGFKSSEFVVRYTPIKYALLGVFDNDGNMVSNSVELAPANTKNKKFELVDTRHKGKVAFAAAALSVNMITFEDVPGLEDTEIYLVNTHKNDLYLSKKFQQIIGIDTGTVNNSIVNKIKYLKKILGKGYRETSKELVMSFSNTYIKLNGKKVYLMLDTHRDQIKNAVTRFVHRVTNDYNTPIKFIKS